MRFMVVLLVLIRITVRKLLNSIRHGRYQRSNAACRRPRRYNYTPMWCLDFIFSLGKGLAPAIEGDHGGVRYFSLANWTLWMLIRGKACTLDVEPFVDARPAVEVAAEGDHWFVCKF